jgi:hypothetical protein
VSSYLHAQRSWSYVRDRLLKHPFRPPLNLCDCGQGAYSAATLVSDTEVAMPTLRRSFPTVEGVQECDQCSKAAEIVIEEYPTRFEHKNLCRECATFA